MRVFLTGPTGYIGSAVAEALMTAGHSVVGLVRTKEDDRELRDRGITPFVGDLRQPHSLVETARQSDGVISTATTNDGSADSQAINAMLGALEGSQKPFVYTSGIWVLGNTGETVADEGAALHPVPLVKWREDVEAEVLDAVKRGVRGIVIRPAMVYGRGGGVFSMFVQSATESGAARYVGDGENRWPLVHIEDLADLYVRAVEVAPAGTILHAVEGPSIKVKEIAEAASFGADAGGRTESWPLEAAREKLGPFADALVLDQQVSGEKGKSLLGWNPHGISILDDLRYGSYAMARINP